MRVLGLAQHDKSAVAAAPCAGDRGRSPLTSNEGWAEPILVRSGEETARFMRSAVTRCSVSHLQYRPCHDPEQ